MDGSAPLAGVDRPGGEARRPVPAERPPGFSTRAVHAGQPGAPVRQTPSSVPIYQTSTWRFDSGEE
ncbi:MAG TPA: hypothetical protein VFN50_08235, partial [Acidimicrobiales bacterium]|nr:hypothetical protein [Acidimicrobiales bacterium]